MIDLQKETWRPIAESFSKLSESIKESLESRHIMPKEIVQSLAGFFDVNQILDSDDAMIFREVKQQCESAQSIADFWSVVLDFVSFYSFKLLKAIVYSKHSTKADKENLENYEKQFIVYSEKLLSNYDKEVSVVNSDCHTKVTVKIKKKYRKISEEHLDEFKEKLSDAIGVLSGHLFLTKLEPGCTVLTYHAPLIVEAAAFPLSDEQIDLLKKLGVIWLHCGRHRYSMVCYFLLFQATY